MTKRPERTRTYHGLLFDSTYWDSYSPRPGDIVVSTSAKAGTTWVQVICGLLIFQNPEPTAPLDDLSPWFDLRLTPPAVTVPLLEAQTHRRFIKSHLPMDGIPYYDDMRYIVVGRDTRDVFMSWVKHLENMAPHSIAMFNAKSGAELLAVADKYEIDLPPEQRAVFAKMRPWEGPVFPDLDVIADRRTYWRKWITTGAFPWEQDGWPAVSHHAHLNTWWRHRGLENILFVHFNDLLADLDGEMRRIAAFLDIPVDEGAWPVLVDAATFKSMKRKADLTAPGTSFGAWNDPKEFFHKGTNKRWHEVLTDDDIALYRDNIARTLEPASARWLEEGRLAFADPRNL